MIFSQKNTRKREQLVKFAGDILQNATENTDVLIFDISVDKDWFLMLIPLSFYSQTVTHFKICKSKWSLMLLPFTLSYDFIFNFKQQDLKKCVSVLHFYQGFEINKICLTGIFF